MKKIWPPKYIYKPVFLLPEHGKLQPVTDMNLTIDIGNTCTKTVIFSDTTPVFKNVSNHLSRSLIDKLIKNFPLERGMLSSVTAFNKNLLIPLKKNIYRFENFSPSTSIPIKNLYKTPLTLGNDRLANAIAGAFLFPGKNVLVIDAGTCIKFDFINSRKQYLGGSISPGMEMRFKALHKYTGKLPLVEAEKVLNVTGDTTQKAIQSGVMIGVREEILGIIRIYQKKYNSLEIILTGGDALRFAKDLNLSIFAATDLVNIGLNEIIRFGSKKSKK